jgi:glycosyltransferase involved in cell wall biosynthesis
MVNNPAISIIVPVYGVEEYLSKCIESILSQTFADFELILVDDGSIDRCPQICDEYSEKDMRIKVIHKKNEGQGVARNTALDIAKGDYIGFVDGDDWIEKDMYEQLYDAAVENNADIAMCDIKTFDGEFWLNHNYFKEIILLNNDELMYEYINSRIFAGPCNKLYKKQLFYNLRFPQFRAREDIYITHLILGRCQKAIHIGSSKYIQFIRRESTENKKFNKSKLALIDAMKSLQDYLYTNYPRIADEAIIKVMGAKISILEDILKSFLYKRYRNEYKNVKNSLEGDLKFILSLNLEDKEEIIKKAKLIDNNNVLYILSVYKGMIIYKYNRLKGRVRLWLIKNHLWWKAIQE